VPRHHALAAEEEKDRAEEEDGPARTWQGGGKEEGTQALSTSPLISIVVAMAENRVIGHENALPWHLPEDLKRFKAHTMGKPIVMGRKTYESIGRALPGRLNIVMTRNPQWRAEGVVTVQSFEQALERAGDVPEIAVIGGAELFRLALPRAQRIYLTLVHAQVSGDTVFPEIDRKEWIERDRETRAADERHAYAMTFSILERKN
jgi:dihydrofolate reductase